uniref:Uncharacterized protein n=1 Tax=Timema douglasi TaxID=61478 RepID=A0A7R8VAZ3_TIMDO|nr:unnamed protein product [Timema douglasi]
MVATNLSTAPDKSRHHSDLYVRTSWADAATALAQLDKLAAGRLMFHLYACLVGIFGRQLLIRRGDVGMIGVSGGKLCDLH